MQTNYHFNSADSPILISIPHAGMRIPATIASNMTSVAKLVPDTDWHVPLLYDFAKNQQISVLSAEYSRYVIDLNRPPDNASLYSGQDTTGLCPIDTFDKQAIYIEGKKPSAAEIEARITQYWRSYHAKLTEELRRIKAIHGVAILWDAHSIASKIPRFFDGQLPDLNFGTVDGHSCDATLQAALLSTIQNSANAKNYCHVFNGRFKGGYITRHYGSPEANIHAVQLEISQCTYMQEVAPYAYKPDLARNLKLLLEDLLQSGMRWAHQHKTN
jgi:N-formylglutamate deformylase